MCSSVTATVSVPRWRISIAIALVHVARAAVWIGARAVAQRLVNGATSLVCSGLVVE